jgi:hypothetical protein
LAAKLPLSDAEQAEYEAQIIALIEDRTSMGKDILSVSIQVRAHMRASSLVAGCLIGSLFCASFSGSIFFVSPVFAAPICQHHEHPSCS